jgi:pyruvate,water dikinase
MKMPCYVRWFKEIGLEDIAEVGGKNASLGEMYRELTPMGINVPDGFAITVEGYWDTIREAGVVADLENLLNPVDKDDVHDLEVRAQKARNLIENAPLPIALSKEISEVYQQYISLYGEDISVAVRSSATAEDLPTASFAGQHDTFLNIHSERELLNAYIKCLASLFTSRAIAYRINNNFDHFKVALSVGVMKMVRSDLASSGVMFSIDTESGFKDAVFITAAYGLGENIVQGNVSPDEFYVHKPTFEQGYRAVLRKYLGDKSVKMIYANNSETIQEVETTSEDKKKFCISDEEILKLAEYAIKTEEHYSTKAGEFRPMDMEWAKDGVDSQLYLIQARPETVISQQDQNILKQYHLKEAGEVIIKGRATGTKIAVGRARLVANEDQLSAFQVGDVLIADNTSPDWGPVFKKASAIVTNRGGRTCHAAIVAREHGIPAIVGTEHATQRIHDGQLLTISCAEGEVGKVYEGKLGFEIKTIDLSSIKKPRTKLMINLGNPSLAFKLSSLPCDGVGLARMEFIINNLIGVHPMALVHLDKVEDSIEREKIENLVSNYESPQKYFIHKLSEGAATIAAAFYPKPVIVRMSDFKTNEYANLIGGKYFEPSEENPMLGFRGASRYAHPDYEEGFALECKAMYRVRNEMGFDNVVLMIPFCRRVQEGKAVLEVMSTHGLRRGENALKIYVMCEIPNNVIQIDEFLDVFDGISIGSNDLTQLTLGVDRDSETVSFDFDERDPGVLKMIKLAVEGAKRNMKYSGICGQAPSDYPEITEFLVNLGIDSISLNPDSLLETILRVNKLESKKIFPIV